MKATLYSWGLIFLTLVAFVFWVFAAQPNDSQIESLRTPPAPLPNVNLQVLNQESFTKREVNGTLPIDLGTRGREDPFAGI